jgi:hypothetical protein
MATWQTIPQNFNWEYDTEVGAAGITTTPFGQELYMNCRHKLIHGASGSNDPSRTNEISKTYWSAPRQCNIRVYGRAIGASAPLPFNFIGEYDNGYDYTYNDVVSYADVLWKRIGEPNTGYPPYEGSPYWELFSSTNQLQPSVHITVGGSSVMSATLLGENWELVGEFCVDSYPQVFEVLVKSPVWPAVFNLEASSGFDKTVYTAGSLDTTPEDFDEAAPVNLTWGGGRPVFLQWTLD